MKITGIGETVLDIIFKDDQPTAAIPGGSTFNAMISLGRTAVRDFPGTEVRMVTETGDDHVGDIVVSFMAENGVGTGAVTRNPGTQTHVSLAFLDADNNASYEFYKDHASARLQDESVGAVTFDGNDYVLFGSYFAINPKIRNHTAMLLSEASKAGAVLYYDINFRKNHLSDIEQTMGNIEENCSLSDFVRGSDEDFGYLFGTTDPERIYHDHISRHCRNFICTCGSRPVHVFCGESHLVFPVGPVRTVSTIGAGDNFNAGFLYALLSEGISRRNMELLDAAMWERLVGIAVRFSANVCCSMRNYVDRDFIPLLAPYSSKQ